MMVLNVGAWSSSADACLLYVVIYIESVSPLMFTLITLSRTNKSLSLDMSVPSTEYTQIFLIALLPSSVSQMKLRPVLLLVISDGTSSRHPTAFSISFSLAGECDLRNRLSDTLVSNLRNNASNDLPILLCPLANESALFVSR